MLRRVSLSLAALVLAAGSLALAGCSSSPQPKAADSTGTAAAPAPAEGQALTGNPWHWVATQTPVEWIVADDPAKYTIQFNADGSAVLRADCNRGRGTYTTLLPTAHTRTNIEVIRRFLEVDISLHETGPDTWRVVVQPGAGGSSCD